MPPHRLHFFANLEKLIILISAQTEKLSYNLHMNSLIPAASCRIWYTQDTSFNISLKFQVFKTCGDHNWTLQEEQILSSSEILESQEGQIIYACVHDDFWGCLFHQIFYCK